MFKNKMIYRVAPSHTQVSAPFQKPKTKRYAHLRLAKQLIRNDGFPEQEAVLEAVHARVLRELLVERGDGREEDDRIDVVEERRPRRTQRARAPDVVHEPLVSGFGA